MAMLKTSLAPWSAAVSHARIHGRCRIGNRDFVGYGVNGSANYKDDAHFPFPAIRFRENTEDVCALRRKECGDWRSLCCDEKKALYRASFCQTFAEFQAPTGQWKMVLGGIFFTTSFAFWFFTFYHHFVQEPPPESYCDEWRSAQLRRMLEIHAQPIDGLSSKWDYDNDRWKTSLAPWSAAVSHARIHGRCRIGNRDVVGYGVNGSANYKDDAHFPFPAIRFKENTKDICALRQKECGDWKMLCCEEKKALYRASFCQTFAEFQAPTGQWKMVLGGIFFTTSFAFWFITLYHHFVQEPLPESYSMQSQMAQFRRMLELHVNPIDGLSSHWDYDYDRWKN